MKFKRRFVKKFKYNYKTRFLLPLLVLVCVSLGLGYAYLQTDLAIVGVTKLKDNEWNVHFDNVQPVPGSVEPVTAPSISELTTVSFSAQLENPGDKYEFYIDVVNSGTIDAMVDSLILLPELTTDQAKYFSYNVIYSDGIEIEKYHLLEAGSTETLKVSFKYLENADTTNYPQSDTTFNVSVTVNYIQANENATNIVPDPESFSTDSWPTIIRAVKKGNTSAYNVGDTKTIDMGTLGTHTLRIANKSTPTECSTEGFSQTACGFVLEFADIITEHNMNPSGEYKGTTYNSGWNVDGWPASSMRIYVNTDIYNALPTELKNRITDTIVVSGHGSTSGETNFTSTDKLYLLSAHEVQEDVDGDTSRGIDYWDTAYNNTRQLDYYAGLNVTTSSYSGAIKQRNGTNSYWWLRSASYPDSFHAVNYKGSCVINTAFSPNGVSPAFRLG